MTALDLTASSKKRTLVPGTEGIYAYGEAFYLSYRARDAQGQSKPVMRKAIAKNLTEAKKERRALIAAVDNGAAPVETNLTVGGLRERHLADVTTRVALRKLAPGTLRRYVWAWDQSEKHLRPSQKVRDVRTQDIVRVVNSLQLAGLSAASANLVLAVLGKAWAGAIGDGLVKSSPCKIARDDRPGAGTDKDCADAEVKVMTPAELRAFLEAAPEPWRLFWLLLSRTGLRPSEALGLRREDIDLTEGLLHVRGQLTENREWTSRLKTPKSRRTIPLPASLRVELERQLRWFSASNTFVFTTTAGLPWTQREVSRNFRVTAKRIGLEGCSAKGLRHYFGSHLLESGIPLKSVSEAMGHADVGVTSKVYMHELDRLANDDKIRTALEAMGA